MVPQCVAGRLRTPSIDVLGRQVVIFAISSGDKPEELDSDLRGGIFAGALLNCISLVSIVCEQDVYSCCATLSLRCLAREDSATWMDADVVSILGRRGSDHGMDFLLFLDGYVEAADAPFRRSNADTEHPALWLGTDFDTSNPLGETLIA